MAFDTNFGDVGLLQIDFAENFVCQAKNEIQNAHWNQQQLTLFTSALYFNGDFQSKVFVSDFPSHTKESIVPYLYRLILKIWSDGPTSQFKNKFMAAMIPHLENHFKIKITWNYFATAYGKGCIDGIGATTKKIVRNHIKANDCIVNNSSDFMKTFKLSQSKIQIEEMAVHQFNEINEMLGVDKVFSNAKNIRDILSAHQMKVVNGKIVTHIISNHD